MRTVLTIGRLIDTLSELGKILREPDQQLEELIQLAEQYNGWFIPQNSRQAIAGIGGMLNRENIEKWLTVEFEKVRPGKKHVYNIGLILAGNIPAVGFHDILCVLVAGHRALVKLSSQDQKLIPYIFQKLTDIEPAFDGQIEYVERLKNFDAVIATGSNNTSRYFEYYFKNVPHIIRKNRNSIAVLTGKESTNDLKQLGKDVFDYFGLGCRSVSKIYVPAGYDFKSFFEAIESFNWIGNHNKYRNNYDYNKSIFLVNGDSHLDNGFLLLKQDNALQSPLATLYYETYDDLKSLEKKLVTLNNQIQCVVSAAPLKISNQQVYFGDSQKPKLWDYADGVNTMRFLFDVV